MVSPFGVDPVSRATLHDVLRTNWATVRLFVHVVAATVWVGGQLTLAGLVPGLRAAHPDAPRFAARRFNLIAWPAFGLLWVTGIWNIVEAHNRPNAWTITLLVKILVVLLSGFSAVVHSGTTSTRALAIFGALSGLSALGALYLGLLLRNGTP